MSNIEDHKKGLREEIIKELAKKGEAELVPAGGGSDEPLSQKAAIGLAAQRSGRGVKI